MAALDADALRLQLLHQRHERFVVRPFDRNDLRIRTSMRRIPHRFRSRRVPEIKDQVQPIARRNGDTGCTEKIRQIKNVRQVGNDKAIEICCRKSVSKLGMASRDGVARSKAHKEILDRLFLAACMNAIQETLELGKRG